MLLEFIHFRAVLDAFGGRNTRFLACMRIKFLQMQILQIHLAKLASVSILKTTCVFFCFLFFLLHRWICLLKLWQDVACALSQKKTPQAPRCTVGYEAVAEPISMWALAEKKKPFLLFCAALRLYRIICDSEVIIGCDRKTWGHGVRLAHLPYHSYRAVANVVITWFDVEFNFFSPLKTIKKAFTMRNVMHIWMKL